MLFRTSIVVILFLLSACDSEVVTYTNSGGDTGVFANDFEGKIYYQVENGYKCKNKNGKWILSYKSKIVFLDAVAWFPTVAELYGDRCSGSLEKLKDTALDQMQFSEDKQELLFENKNFLLFDKEPTS